MPQLNKGGKFVFGICTLGEGLAVRLPPQALEEYGMEAEGRVVLMSGSKSTGGFVVSRLGLLLPSKLGHILKDLPALADGSLAPGEVMPYKGRLYGAAPLAAGRVLLTPGHLKAFGLSPGSRLLCIRSSDIAFTLGAKGPLWERAGHYAGEIPTF